MLDLNELSKKIYDHNLKVGWWDGETCIYEKLQLVSTEIAEATEAERKDSMDDKLKHRKGAEVELADALIRVLDLGGRFNLSVDQSIWLDSYIFPSWLGTIGSYHHMINHSICDMAHIYKYYISPDKSHINWNYKWLIMSIYHCAETFGYDIEGAMLEKIEFNKTRPDHKRENRQKQGGKKF